MAFTSKYLRAANAALEDSSGMNDWRSLFADTCTVCLSGFDVAEEIYETEGRIIGGQLSGWTVSAQEITETDGVLLVEGEITTATVVDASGATVDSYPAVPDVAVVYTARQQTDGSWLMIGGDLIR